MKRWIGGLVLASSLSLSGAGQAQPGCRPAADGAFRAANAAVLGCIIDRTKALEPSGDTPDTVADAAITQCDRYFDNLGTLAIGCSDSWSPEFRAHLVEQYDVDFRKAARRNAAALVVNIRAAGAHP